MRRWLLPAGVLAATLAGAIALWGQRDRRWYVEAAPPLAVLVGGIAVAVGAAGVHQLAVAAERNRRRQRDEVAAAARAARGRLIGRLDHEIKNQVTGMLAGLANVAATDLPPPAAQALASVDAQARRLSQLVADLRKLGELETAEIEREPVDLAEVVAEAATASADLRGAAEHSVNVVVPEVPWRVGVIRGDRDLIFLATMNLVANAVKFSPPGASIELRALEEDRHAVIEVADTGIGIPAGELELVWEELARGEAARAVPGSGIGLALVRTILERHGGDVSLRSRPRQGTVVRLRFPLP